MNAVIISVNICTNKIDLLIQKKMNKSCNDKDRLEVSGVLKSLILFNEAKK